MKIKVNKKNTVITLFLLMILFFSSSAVIAAENLELEEAVKLLIEENRTLKNARQDIDNAEKDEELAVRSYFPTLDLQSSYTKFDEGQQLPLGGYGPDENYSTSISLTQPIWMGGKVSMQKEIAAYGLEIARTEYEKTVEDQIFSLIQAYYGVLQAEGMVEIRQEALDIVNEHLRVVKNNLEAGIAIRRDLLQSQIEQRNAEEELTAARNNLKIARRRLAQLLNYEAQYSVEKPKTEFDFSLDQDQLFKTAVENDPQLMILELNKEIVKLNQKLEGQYYRPNVSLNGSYDWQGEEFMDEKSWSMTLGVNVPLYDGGKGGINADKQENELQKLANNRQDLLENLNIEVEDSILTVKENAEKIDLEILSLENAAENLEIANKSYEAGVASNTDVIDAQSTYNQAKISLLQSEYEYDIERFRTLYKSGRLKEYFGDVVNNEK
ncbi:MAG: outer membrane efflux protein [Halanaerobium sp. 4-GBenrich]|jgi:outer membrane protein TolC|uniref:Outer membrane protein TolC n=1 Tax=Halanaerobium congolense TaxID=54121 RepID=A0A1M7NNQ5_9FIRM|nr:TolC family protein [Halanaerobium congolense]KXS48095.1 MAG: outer membrane efflux protein [Halanaerobium sp. T82-1]ODS49793.1 MAG: outer membrane efflux protein [Halanaerobium sp. 4-GBenrich]PUU88918.1 MAG: outer membrane efflux protein [Halanaerobium sp.]PTX15707.1 outer membrane protein TolC [Halanaerobium congolense]PXV68658.1 outer membrane protein TolC [Halanaerobium congolense]